MNKKTIKKKNKTNKQQAPVYITSGNAIRQLF